MIHIADSQTDRILGFITEDEFWDDKHYKSLKDTLETYDFTTFADKRFSEHLAKRNRIIIPDEDGKYVEFVIENTRKYRDSNGGLFVEVYTSATYIELAKAKIIKPQTTQAWTAKQHAEWALAGTEWEVGDIDFSGSRTLVIEEHTNPYSFLKRLASEFDLELHFRVETDGQKVTRRYVDLVEHIGNWNGREVEFGKDLIGIERKEDNSNIVTAMIGLGPEREDGTRLQVFVEDRDALQRWGRNGQHIIEVYEPESTDQNMTEERLRELTKNELEKRINSIVEYTADISDLEKVQGLEHEKIQFGDTLRIKDTQFNPPLYIEARVHTMERSIKKNGYKKVTLGDYIEYTEEEVHAIWKQLQAEIAKKVSMAEVTEVVYTKPEVDERDDAVREHADNVAENAKIEAIQVAAEDASQKAKQAEDSAKEYTDGRLENTVAKDIFENTVTDLLNNIAQKVDSTRFEQVESELRGIAEGLQHEISEHAYTLEEHGGKITKLETDVDEVEGKISTTIAELQSLEETVSRHETQIEANAREIALKADKQELDLLSGTVSGISSELSVMAGKIEAKAERSEVEKLESDVSKVSQDVSKLTVDVDGIKTNVSSISQTVTNHGTQISNINSSITQLSGEIESKVDKTEYETDKDGIISRLNSAETRITQTENEIQTKVNQTTFDALENRVTQAESTITQTADNVTVAFDRIDSIDGVLNSAVTTIDASGVTVKDGSFYLEDDTSVTKYSIVPKTNLIADHSFEMLESTGTPDATHKDFAIKPQVDGYKEWRTVGSPRLLSVLQTGHVSFSLFFYGFQAVVVSNSNYVEQYFVCTPGETYTVSAYFTGSSRSTSGVPRIDVRLEDGITGEVKKTWTKNFQSVTFGQKLTRNALTFTVPADSVINEDIVVVTFRANSGWVVVDGAQVIEGETPTLYDPENSVWALLRGVKGYEFSTLTVNGWIEASTVKLSGGTMYGGEGTLWWGNGYAGKGLYLHDGSGWTKIH